MMEPYMVDFVELASPVDFVELGSPVDFVELASPVENYIYTCL